MVQADVKTQLGMEEQHPVLLPKNKTQIPWTDYKGLLSLNFCVFFLEIIDGDREQRDISPLIVGSQKYSECF
jgi:hypothetical protein